MISLHLLNWVLIIVAALAVQTGKMSLTMGLAIIALFSIALSILANKKENN